jgi:hypothetical protein
MFVVMMASAQNYKLEIKICQKFVTSSPFFFQRVLNYTCLRQLRFNPIVRKFLNILSCNLANRLLTGCHNIEMK